MEIGADRAILVQTDEELQPLAVAKLLKALLDKEQPGRVRAGGSLFRAVPELAGSL